MSIPKIKGIADWRIDNTSGYKKGDIIDLVFKFDDSTYRGKAKIKDIDGLFLEFEGIGELKRTPNKAIHTDMNRLL